jgi:hypothetical protein
VYRECPRLIGAKKGMAPCLHENKPLALSRDNMTGHIFSYRLTYSNYYLIAVQASTSYDITILIFILFSSFRAHTSGDNTILNVIFSTGFRRMRLTAATAVRFVDAGNGLNLLLLL